MGKMVPLLESLALVFDRSIQERIFTCGAMLEYTKKFIDSKWRSEIVKFSELEIHGCSK